MPGISTPETASPWTSPRSAGESALPALTPRERSHLVLVVDDHVDSRTIARIVLQRAGFRVAEASSGIEGLETALALRPSAVLLDMILPGIDGWEIAARLRADPRTANTTIVALTALVGHHEHERARSAGCDDVLVKPASPYSIVAAIASLVGAPLRSAI